MWQERTAEGTLGVERLRDGGERGAADDAVLLAGGERLVGQHQGAERLVGRDLAHFEVVRRLGVAQPGRQVIPDGLAGRGRLIGREGEGRRSAFARIPHTTRVSRHHEPPNGQSSDLRERRPPPKRHGQKTRVVYIIFKPLSICTPSAG